ncbi:DUF4097 family beta strand repeat-containing protein [Anaerocolumna sp.]|uniref:DUF4097 family beta strand repeat-containing protein n=1 Tax=Anaerocolumna sp. TaxID=2041569 RepID=UPI0028AD194E|nr:DUF4097 family beta strand repeat-containing protein [Anaerocolumna sp.]
MNEFQKVIKYLAMGFAIFLTVTIIGGIATGIFALTGVFNGFTTSGEAIDINKSFDGVKSITINHGVGTLKVRTGESDKVEIVANNVSEHYTIEKSFSGNLTLKNRTRFWFWNWFDGNLKSDVTVYLPKDFVAEKFIIDAGAGDVNIEGLETKELEINGGAGDIRANNIIAQSAEIDGGVGNVNFKEVTLNNTTIDSGVGNVDIKGYLFGKTDIDCGVGNVDLDLIGSMDDYNIKIDKGLGNVKINGEKYSNTNWNSVRAENSLDIDGGVGDISINFE